jgi:lysophospholipase L1-like esterase
VRRGTTFEDGPPTARARARWARAVLAAMAVLLVLVVLAGLELAEASAPTGAGLRLARLHWVATWAASPQAATRRRPLAVVGVDDQTVREIVVAHVAGRYVTVRFTNAFGTRPLRIAAAAIAPAGAHGPGLAGLSVRLRFAQRRAVTVAPGSEVTSDAAHLSVRAFERLAVSLFVSGDSGPATLHTVARQLSYIAAGNRVVDPGTGPFGTQTASWFFLDELGVAVPPRVIGTVVALGDSITDGFGSRAGVNRRWPDDLARRLDARPGPTLSVVNAGISGNRLLTGSPCYGPSAEARFGPDVADIAGARDVIVLEGINDIGMSRLTTRCSAPHRHVTAAQLIAGYEQLIGAAHRDRLRIFGGTLLPFAGAVYWTPAGEQVREAVNRWIRRSGAFDGVIDFAAAVADPRDPRRLAPRYDHGDHLHPNDAGDRALAGAVDLAMLRHG